MNWYVTGEVMTLAASATLLMVSNGKAHWFLGLTVLIELWRQAVLNK